MCGKGFNFVYFIASVCVCIAELKIKCKCIYVTMHPLVMGTFSHDFIQIQFDHLMYLQSLAQLIIIYLHNTCMVLDGRTSILVYNVATLKTAKLSCNYVLYTL